MPVISMIEDPIEMDSILPAWFCMRMAEDEWGFGLLMTSGIVIGISHIYDVSSDGKWIDVSLLPNGMEAQGELPGQMMMAPCDSRKMASINVGHIQAAFEIWYT